MWGVNIVKILPDFHKNGDELVSRIYDFKIRIFVAIHRKTWGAIGFYRHDLTTNIFQKNRVVKTFFCIFLKIFATAKIKINALGGALLGCVLLALTMANAGGAWDNAKKYVEKGNLGGKGSDVHAAAVVGDTVGDPFKDTSGPAMNILINVMAIVSLVIAPVLA